MSASVFFQALAMTLVIELPIFVVLLSHFARVPAGRAAVAATLINLATYPLFALMIAPAAGRVLPPAAALAVSEGIVCCLEAGMLGLWLRRDPLLLIGASLVANGCSLAGGLIAFSFLNGS